MMDDNRTETALKARSFGRRKVAPRVCIVDTKKHIRVFLSEAMEELGFIPCECPHADDLNNRLDVHLSDLVIVGLSSGGVDGGEIMNLLAAREFSGKVLVLGPSFSVAVTAVQEHGESLGLDMLPLLATPFGSETLRDSVAMLLPSEASPPPPPVDVAEAISAGWLELWYQPKIDTRTFSISGIEALVRMRHPNWGIVTPAYFVPDKSDPRFRALSEFVIDRAIHDWHYFLSNHGPTNIAINLPLAFLQDSDSVRSLCRTLPTHPAFQGLTIEINGGDVAPNIEAATEIARQLKFANVGVSLDEIGADWPALMEIRDCPFVEIKVDGAFVTGCADNRLKQTVCRRILELADDYGARTVAVGVETVSDFVAVRDMGFDLAQGYLFSKPIEASKLVRSVFKQPLKLPN
jgi:EAL domain-containing protein (putative c-di-GMP-specific phosphodiesterase class I)/CheY-like chemotaxis protein